MPTTITSAGIVFNDNSVQTTSALSAGAIGATQIANNAVTAAKLGTNERLGLCKAWVNFNGTITFPGNVGVSYSRSGTTVTVTATAHGQSNGVSERIYNATDSGLNGPVTITVVNANTFTFQTTATGAPTGTLSYAFDSIRSSYNVSSVTKAGTGSYYVNLMAGAVADSNYSVGGSADRISDSRSSTVSVNLATQTTSGFGVLVTGNYASGVDYRDSTAVHIQVFGN